MRYVERNPYHVVGDAKIMIERVAAALSISKADYSIHVDQIVSRLPHVIEVIIEDRSRGLMASVDIATRKYLPLLEVNNDLAAAEFALNLNYSLDAASDLMRFVESWGTRKGVNTAQAQVKSKKAVVDLISAVSALLPILIKNRDPDQLSYTLMPIGENRSLLNFNARYVDVERMRTKIEKLRSMLDK